MGAAGTLEQEIEGTGSLTMAAAFVTLAYLPLSWLLQRYNYLSFSLAWISKEIWAVLLAIGSLSIIGAIESFLINPQFTALFAIPFFTTLFLSVLHFSNDQSDSMGQRRLIEKHC